MSQQAKPLVKVSRERNKVIVEYPSAKNAKIGHLAFQNALNLSQRADLEFSDFWTAIWDNYQVWAATIKADRSLFERLSQQKMPSGCA